MSVGYRPLRDEILVEAPVISETTDAGVFKGPKVKDEEERDFKSQFLKVIAVGPRVQEVKVGDLVKVRGMYALFLDKVAYGQCFEHQVLGVKVDE